MTGARHRIHLGRRREESARERRIARIGRPPHAAEGPIVDAHHELAPEQVCVHTGLLLDRRSKVRRHPTE
jgi:hypothetical protein